MSGREPTRELPEDEAGSRFYTDGTAWHPLILSIWVFLCIIMLISLVGWIGCLVVGLILNMNIFWIPFGVCVAVFVVFFIAWGVVFLTWFLKYTKKKIRFLDKEATITTTYGMFPCYTSQVVIDCEQINSFLIKPTYCTNCCSGNLAKFRVYLETLGQHQFLIASSNTLMHQKKLVKLLLQQEGLTNLGEVERVTNKNLQIKRENTKREKQREQILRDNAEKRARKIKMQAERQNMAVEDMEDAEKQEAQQNWKRLRDHKRIKAKYGGK